MRDTSTVPPGRRSICFNSEGEFEPAAGRSLNLLAVLVVFFGLGSPVVALEVRDVRWGLNNALKPSEFNLCSIDLINPTSEPFQSPITLKPSGSFVRGDVPPCTELNLYLGPGETRTVQFVPFVSQGSHEWVLSWGSSNTERFDILLPTRRVIGKVTVQFVASQGVSAPISGLERFQEDDFPIGASGLDALGSVVLDHVPQRWDAVRMRAFRDWLGQGGRLYLIQGRDGKPLDFPASLAELNFPGERFHVGQGTVTRHAVIKDVGEIPGLVTEVAKSIDDPNNPEDDYASLNEHSNQAETQIFDTMRAMIRPNHNWGLIFLLAMIYLLILFPGIWLISRKRGDYRITYSLILGTVVVFSWFYSEIGKRGYGESTGLREVMLAYPLGNQRLALKKFCSLFVTQGGPYPIAAEGEGAVLALNEGFSGRVDSGIINRPQAGFTPDIPPYSACSYQESTVLPTQGDYSIQVKTLEVGPDLKKIEVALGSAIPTSAQVYLVSENNVYTLTHNGNHWVNSSQPIPTPSEFLFEYGYQWNQLLPEQYDKNLVACLASIATQAPIVNSYNNYGYSPEPPDATAPGPKAFEAGHLLVHCDAPAELLPSQYFATGKVMFVSAVDSSMATTIPSP